VTEEKLKPLIANARNRVQKAIDSASKSNDYAIISRYYAAIAVNFTDWIGKTIPFTRSRLANKVLVENLRCESEEDHIGMLLNFVKLSKALPDWEDYCRTESEVAAIRSLFKDFRFSGLYGTALCAAFENLSEVFIPDLAERALSCGCNDFTYTDKHGEADIEHSRALLEATVAESEQDYEHAEQMVETAIDAAADLIIRIYTSK
jgi:hypothetical protein